MVSLVVYFRLRTVNHPSLGIGAADCADQTLAACLVAEVETLTAAAAAVVDA